MGGRSDLGLPKLSLHHRKTLSGFAETQNPKPKTQTPELNESASRSDVRVIPSPLCSFHCAPEGSKAYYPLGIQVSLVLRRECGNGL